MKFPSIRQTGEQSPTIQDLIECVEILTGRRRNREIDYGTIDGVRTKVLDIVHLCNMINQLHESGVTKADLEKLHDITVEAAPIGKIKARAYISAEQDIKAGGISDTKVRIDTISFDTEGVVDTEYSLIMPYLPGYYVVMGNVMAIGVPDGKRVAAMIIKNGEPVSYGTAYNQGAEGLLSSSASDIIYMNGETDCLELWAQNTSSSALALLTGNSNMNYISVLGPF
jgi:hypothetical protein